MREPRTSKITLTTSGRGFHEITRQVQSLVSGSEIRTGLCNLFIQHTSASLIICENADPDVLHDLERWMSDLVEDGDARFVHRAEGPDDMPAHIRSVLTASSLSIPVVDGRCELGTWQGIFLWEHRHQPHQRQIRASLIG